MTKLKSGVHRELKGDFLLDEDGIRRIAGVLELKAKDLPHPCSVVFHVEREDDRFYETTNLSDVLADANTPGHRIDDFAIELRNSDPNKTPQPWERDWIAAIHFRSTRSKQEIIIGAEDRNWALLLADEIEPQVVRTLVAKQIPSWLLVGLYIGIGVWLHTLIKMIPSFPLYDVVQYLRAAVWMGVAFMAIETIGERPTFISKWAGPESSFHWGEQASSHSHRETLRQNLFWVVIVGFFVSIGATIYTSTLLSQTVPSSNPASQVRPYPNAEVERDTPQAARPSP